MRQAIINYMQRNGALDIPIVPMPSSEDEDAEQVCAADVDLTEDSTESCDIQEAESAYNEIIINDTEAAVSENIEASADTEIIKAQEYNEESQLSESEPTDFDEEDIDELPEDYTEVTDEVSDMLNQADELASLQVPEPVVVPDHVDIPEPDPIEPEVEEIEEPEKDETESIDETNITEYVTDMDADDAEDSDSVAPVKKIHWLRSAIIAFTVIILLAAGLYYYNNHYLLPVENISVEGNEDYLIVSITSDIDESLVEVVCSDTYGNKMRADIIDGRAEFRGLVPNTAYSIKLNAKGFHRITGSATTAYSTPIQTNIVQFDAITGNTEDSVILSFTAEGPGSSEWKVEYSADGEEPQSATFVESQMVTITNLKVGKAYTFRLVPKDDLYITGQTEIIFTPRKLVRAEKLIVTSCLNNKLTASWSVPEGESVSGWSVRCYNENYSQTIVTSETSAIFENLDHSAAYEIEVKAIGMSVGSKVSVPANSITVSNLTIDTSSPTQFALSWETSVPISEDGWFLRYSIVGLTVDETIECKENKAVITSLIPNTTYRIHLEDIKGTVLLGSQVELTTGNPVDFQMEFANFTLTRNDLTFYMVKTPKFPNWGRYDLADSDYTNTYSVGQSASFLTRSKKDCYVSSEICTTTYVIRNLSGDAILSSQVVKVWSDMWTLYNCKMEIPSLPTEPGTYTIEVYYNGGLAHQQEFTIQ